MHFILNRVVRMLWVSLINIPICPCRYKKSFHIASSDTDQRPGNFTSRFVKIWFLQNQMFLSKETSLLKWVESPMRNIFQIWFSIKTAWLTELGKLDHFFMPGRAGSVKIPPQLVWSESVSDPAVSPQCLQLYAHRAPCYLGCGC